METQPDTAGSDDTKPVARNESGDIGGGVSLEALNVLRHDALVARDTIAGLTAELATLAATITAMQDTDLGRAIARIDELEEEREILLSERQRASARHRAELAAVKASPTWRMGSLVLRPVSRLKGRIGS